MDEHGVASVKIERWSGEGDHYVTVECKCGNVVRTSAEALLLDAHEISHDG